MNQKGFAPILLLIFLSLVVILGYWFWNSSTTTLPAKFVLPSLTPDPTALEPSNSIETTNWKTYTNMKYGYTIKYPQTWQVQEDISSPASANKPIYTFLFAEKQEFLPGLRIYVNTTTTPEQWIGENIQFGRSEKIIVDGYQVLKLTGIPEGLENEYVFLDKEGQTIVFFASGVETLKVFNQILTTFKFTQ